MSKQSTKLINVKSKSRLTDKQSYSRKILIGSIIATLIAATPFLFYLYEFVPDTKSWETWFGVYHSNYYESANVGIWVLMMKFVPLVLSILWFFTCKHWWYHALIIPIAMFSFQTISAFNDEIIFMDEMHIIWLLPFMSIIVPSVYLIRAKMFNKINYADKTMEELEEEFMIKPKTFWGKISQYF